MLPTYLRTAPLEEKVLVCQPQNNPQMKRDQIKKELRHPRPTKRVLRRELGWGLVMVVSDGNVVDDES